MTELVVAAAPMYEDGTSGDVTEQTFENRSDHAVRIGAFLLQEANTWIGTTHGDDEVRCDSIDVTISPSPDKFGDIRDWPGLEGFHVGSSTPNH